MQILFTLVDIKHACSQVWQAGSNYKIWCFYGEMGAGKTTFIHHLCEYLGVTTSISSPTYSIINEYESSVAGTIFHMDWYRLKSENEAIDAGVEDCLYSGKLCLVEWPQKAEGLLPDERFTIHLKLIDDATRAAIFDAEPLMP